VVPFETLRTASGSGLDFDNGATSTRQRQRVSYGQSPIVPQLYGESRRLSQRMELERIGEATIA